MPLTILDCTLRDGGYYNNWDFDSALVNQYLKAATEAGIDIVELGLRSFPHEGFHGPYIYSTEDYINTLELPENLTLGVMLNAQTIIQSPLNTSEAIEQLFVPRENSAISLVRVASHGREINACEAITSKLKSLGYQVGLNIMQIANIEEESLTEICEQIASWNSVDVLYFADSVGNMNEDDIEAVYHLIRRSWPGDIGLHAHNNMGKANANCHRAIEIGCTWIDSTITGMGRGAGNAQTEILLSELSPETKSNLDSTALYPIILDFFAPLQKQMGWGMNFAYHFSAIHNIHPSYAQELLNDSRYSSEDILSTLTFLSQNNASQFKTELVSQALHEEDRIPQGEWDASHWCVNKDVLILGSGPSLDKYNDAIHQFIRTHDLITLSLNVHKSIANELIDGFVAVDPKRLTLDYKFYENIHKPIFIPINALPKHISQQLSEQMNICDYDMVVQAEQFDLQRTGCILPQRLSVAYAIALCIAGGVNRIFFAGFDGYAPHDPRHHEMRDTFEVIKNTVDVSRLISLTPSTYPITQGSIYAPYRI